MSTMTISPLQPNNYVTNTEWREEIQRHMGVLRDGFKDDLRIVTDSFKGVEQKLDRLLALKENQNG